MVKYSSRLGVRVRCSCAGHVACNLRDYRCLNFEMDTRETMALARENQQLVEMGYRASAATHANEGLVAPSWPTSPWTFTRGSPLCASSRLLAGCRMAVAPRGRARPYDIQWLGAAPRRDRSTLTCPRMVQGAVAADDLLLPRGRPPHLGLEGASHGRPKLFAQLTLAREDKPLNGCDRARSRELPRRLGTGGEGSAKDILLWCARTTRLIWPLYDIGNRRGSTPREGIASGKSLSVSESAAIVFGDSKGRLTTGKADGLVRSLRSLE
jgi:hypothetical protein